MSVSVSKPESEPEPVRPTRRPGRRLIVLVLLLLAWVGVLAAPAAAEVQPHRLTQAQERIVLRLIDDICGDTWCEGDHAFRFRRFSCSPERGGCRLVVQIASTAQEPLRWRLRAQAVCGFPHYADMVSSGPHGVHTLQPAFYDAVSAAVQAMTATAPHRPRSLPLATAVEHARRPSVRCGPLPHGLVR